MEQADAFAGPTRLGPLVAAALVLPAVAYTVGMLAMPHPTSVELSRKTVDRSSLKGEVLLTTTPAPKIPVKVDFSNKIQMLGIDVGQPVASVGSRVELTFYFKALAEMQESWKVFLHVDSQNGQYRMHGDHFPPDGYTTDKWRSGDMIADRYDLTVPLDAQKGAYDIWLGFYDPAHEDDRLQVTPLAGVTTDGQNRVKLAVLTVQ